MYETPQSPLMGQESAPGAKAALWCGILSIPTGLFCFPVGIVLGIIALVQHGKAKRMVAESPQRFEQLSSAGFVTGIIGLIIGPIFGIIGMMSAIAIPALLGQREKAKSKAVQAQVYQIAAETARVADDLAQKGGHPATPDQVIDAVLADQKSLPANRNVYTPGGVFLHKGTVPTVDGEVTLAAEPQHRDPQTGAMFPAVVIRGQHRVAGRAETVEKAIALD